MGTHTPGPWETLGAWGLDIRPKSPARGDTIGFAPIAKVIGDKRLMDDNEREANAHLIAAAPELLSSLQFAVKLLSALPHVNGTEQLDHMRAIIAKATGGEQ